MPLEVEVVSAERRIWSGEASFVVARTLEGEIGVLPGHQPTLAVLAEDGEVRVDPTDGSPLTASVDGGFQSVEHDRVLVVAERASVADDAARR